MIGNTPVALRCRLGCRGFQDLSGGANSRKSGENGDARPRFLNIYEKISNLQAPEIYPR